ncbi:secreted protein [Cordyceps fumosorosea ARSEF 2679]|uniref:Secreted protein n=1 Tax=Cordyceps fumosorosea (strain ARSEF 2679) TaxID=1081104 RepID=A0A168EQ70_CORFA|nr:secreted protein [Cordyceps fumosorosea ARSEF 2679]OAA74090.1 secreted protein [Cordyceps fumosorosea ARSEF 2679]
MKFIGTLVSILGVAVAAPAPSNGPAPSSVKIKGVSLLGSGCPAGTADVQVDATGTLFEATFSTYEVQTGPGTKAIDWRKNCKLTLNMQFDPGYQFSILDTDMIGFAEIPKGAKGQCSNTFSFTGNSQQVVFNQELNGHYSGPFDLKSKAGIESWSPCGGSTAILNMNTACAITPTHLPALIAVDHISGKLTVKFGIQWRYCPKH